MYDHITQEVCDYAKALIILFMKGCSRLFGKPFLTHIIHILLHIPEDCLAFGNPEEISAYKFEDFNFHLTNQVRTGQKVICQVVNRYEENCYFGLYGPREKSKPGVQILRSLKNGTVRKIQLNGYVYSCDRVGDKFCEINARIFKIHSFERTDGNNASLIVWVREFRGIKRLFSYPCDSQNVGIFQCHDFRPNLRQFPVECITGKFYPIPMQKKTFVLVKLIHQ